MAWSAEARRAAILARKRNAKGRKRRQTAKRVAIAGGVAAVGVGVAYGAREYKGTNTAARRKYVKSKRKSGMSKKDANAKFNRAFGGAKPTTRKSRAKVRNKAKSKKIAKRNRRYGPTTKARAINRSKQASSKYTQAKRKRAVKRTRGY